MSTGGILYRCELPEWREVTSSENDEKGRQKRAASAQQSRTQVGSSQDLKAGRGGDGRWELGAGSRHAGNTHVLMDTSLQTDVHTVPSLSSAATVSARQESGNDTLDRDS